MKRIKYATMYSGAFLGGICFALGADGNAMALVLGFPCVLLAAVASILDEN